MGQSQVVQSLCQDSLFRIGDNFQEKVIRRRAPLKEDFEEPVGELPRLNQFLLQGPPTPHLPDTAEIEDAVTVFLNQPLAAFVVFVVSHARPRYHRAASRTTGEVPAYLARHLCLREIFRPEDLANLGLALPARPVLLVKFHEA